MVMFYEEFHKKKGNEGKSREFERNDSKSIGMDRILQKIPHYLRIRGNMYRNLVCCTIVYLYLLSELVLR